MANKIKFLLKNILSFFSLLALARCGCNKTKERDIQTGLNRNPKGTTGVAKRKNKENKGQVKGPTATEPISEDPPQIDRLEERLKKSDTKQKKIAAAKNHNIFHQLPKAEKRTVEAPKIGHSNPETETKKMPKEISRIM